MVYVLIAWSIALAVSLVLTPEVRKMAMVRRWVCRPRGDRWARRTVALMGGLAIVGATLVGVAPFVTLLPTRALALVLVSTAMFVIGVVDDRRGLPPIAKLLAQVLAAVLLVEIGLAFGFPGERLGAFDKLLTIIWLVGVGNAFNLLDNMDGLCAGIAVIVAGFVTIIQVSEGDVGAAVVTASLGGACLGFLKYNRNPAKIFMGDCGSLFIGQLLAGAVLLSPGDGAGRSVLSMLALPLLVMLTPLMDTTLVTIARKWALRPVSQGGRDHSSHRLVALGLSEQDAVRVLYWLSAVGGAMALAVRWLDWYVSTLLLPVLLFGVVALGWYLGRVRVYENDESLNQVLAHTPIPLLSQQRHRRRMAEVLVDLIAVGAGFYVANALRYESVLGRPVLLHTFMDALPLVIAAHLVGYAVGGVYRGIWQYTSVCDLPRFIKGTILASVLTVLALELTGRRGSLSASLFVINWMVQLLFLGGSRLSFKLLHDRLQGVVERPEAVPVLVVGVGPGAELTLRRLQSDASLGFQPVGALADDDAAVGLEIHGLAILGTHDDIARVLSQHQVEQVLLVDPTFPAEAWQTIRRECARVSIPTRVVKQSIETWELPVVPALGD